MKRILLTVLFALTMGLNAKAQVNVPALETEFVMQLKVTLDAPYVVGETPHGKRTVIPITGGTFEGPLLKGTILSGGADWQLAKGSRTELEAIYNALFLCAPSFGGDFKGIVLNVWKVK